VLCGLYARGGAGWVLGFVALVPWLLALNASRTLWRTLLAGYAMTVAYTAAVFAWFGAAIGLYIGAGEAAGLAVLLLAAPLFQPQFIAFALVRRVVGQRHGSLLQALAAAAAWVAAEWLVPRLLGDTLGHGLHESRLLRQGADLGGAAGLTLLLVLSNEGIAAALARRGGGWRAIAKPLALATTMPVLLACYGLAALSGASASDGPTLRMGLVQSNIVDYERLRREQGAYAVVRDVLDTHFAMSVDAVRRQRVNAVLWSETVYPTTFGQPKSDDGAELDREILAFVDAVGVPLVFGTYDRDEGGEYNAAAFVAPGTGLLGFYRKTRVFPLTEHVPEALDGPVLRRWLPWAGTWRPGSGARVFPLRLADGREIPVLPMICLDDVDPGLGIDGARLGAQAIVTMSNDSWFTGHPHGARLHLAAAAFRSIETRLPQFRVTNNGHSAVIDRTGTVLAGTRMGERTLVVGDVPVGEPPRTLMVVWGDWVGRACVALLALLAAAAAWRTVGGRTANAAPASTAAATFAADVAVLPPAARVAAGVLRGFARVSLVWLGMAMLLGDAVPANRLAHIRNFAVGFLAPEFAAWCVLRAFAAKATIDGGMLVLARGARRLQIAVRDIAAAEPWRLPLPGPGVWLRLSTGARWRYGLALANPLWLARSLAAAGGPPSNDAPPARGAAYLQARTMVARGRLDRPLLKFGLFPLALALPAFRLHQHIAYGSAFGEYHTFGLKAYATTFAIWWAEWAMAVVLSAAALRVAIEAGSLLAVLLRPERAVDARQWLERLGLVALYIGLPMLLLLRIQ
jgi:apolipoprotein N-acyltransferase